MSSPSYPWHLDKIQSIDVFSCRCMPADCSCTQHMASPGLSQSWCVRHLPGLAFQPLSHQVLGTLAAILHPNWPAQGWNVGHPDLVGLRWVCWQGPYISLIMITDIYVPLCGSLSLDPFHITFRGFCVFKQSPNLIEVNSQFRRLEDDTTWYYDISSMNCSFQWNNFQIVSTLGCCFARSQHLTIGVLVMGAAPCDHSSIHGRNWDLIARRFDHFVIQPRDSIGDRKFLWPIDFEDLNRLYGMTWHETWL